MLENELKNQEEFFRKKLKQQATYNKQMSENTLMNDSKFVEMMEKLSEEQSKFYAEKKGIDEKIRVAVDAAKKKVKN